MVIHHFNGCHLIPGITVRVPGNFSEDLVHLHHLPLRDLNSPGNLPWEKEP